MTMEKKLTFGEILDAADKLPLEDQETLADILQRRIIEHRREELEADIRAARSEFSTGKCQPATPDELMDEILA